MKNLLIRLGFLSSCCRVGIWKWEDAKFCKKCNKECNKERGLDNTSIINQDK